MSITLEPGRLALRKPELGGFLMVEVEHVRRDGDFYGVGVTSEDEQPFRADDFLPVLRPGDVVPAGSLLLAIGGPAHMQTWEQDVDVNTATGGWLYPVALLRCGPEEDA